MLHVLPGMLLVVVMPLLRSAGMQRCSAVLPERQNGTSSIQRQNGRTEQQQQCNSATVQQCRAKNKIR
jgi:hypothetical protein